MKYHRLHSTLLSLVGVALLSTACNLPAPEAPPLTPTTFSFPTATGLSTQGIIFGIVWEDICEPAVNGEPPAGCVDPGDGSQRANGIFEAHEPGIAAAALQLGEGACPSTGAGEVQTDSQGRFEIGNLPPGEYCISVDAASPSNLTTLGNGAWTSPQTSPGSTLAQVSVTLAEADGEQVDFGWDPGGTAMPTPTETPSPTPSPEPSLVPTGTATATGTLQPTTSPGDPTSGLGDPSFSDPFDTAANWPLYEDEHVSFQVSDGRMAMTAYNADFWDGWVFPARSTSSDFYAEGEFQFGVCSGRDNLGIIGRGDCPNGVCRAYLFAVTCDGRYNLRIWDGEATTYLIPLTQSGAIPGGSNSTVRLGLWMQDNTIRLYADGTQLADIQDETYDSGGIGLFVGAAATNDFQAWVDSFRFWALP